MDPWAFPCGVGGHIGGGSAGGLGFSVGIRMRNQLEVDSGLYRVVIVVHRGYVKERGVAGADGVAHRLHADAEGAAGGEEASAAGDLPVGLVGDGGLHGVVLVHRMGCVGYVLRGDVDGELAVGVELAGLLGLLRGVVAQRGVVIRRLPCPPCHRRCLRHPTSNAANGRRGT